MKEEQISQFLKMVDERRKKGGSGEEYKVLTMLGVAVDIIAQLQAEIADHKRVQYENRKYFDKSCQNYIS